MTTTEQVAGLRLTVRKLRGATPDYYELAEEIEQAADTIERQAAAELVCPSCGERSAIANPLAGVVVAGGTLDELECPVCETLWAITLTLVEKL